MVHDNDGGRGVDEDVWFGGGGGGGGGGGRGGGGAGRELLAVWVVVDGGVRIWGGADIAGEGIAGEEGEDGDVAAVKPAS